MLEDAPSRLWLPLQVLKTTGGLYSKTKFQKIMFLLQYELKLDEYDFVKHHYGPYSDGLDLDTACYPLLITQKLSQNAYLPDRHYYSYHITDNGQDTLQKLSRNIKPELIESVANKAEELNSQSLEKLLDLAYTQFALKQHDSQRLESEVKEELTKVMHPIKHSYAKTTGSQVTFVLGILEMLNKIFSEMQTKDTVQNGVVFNLSKEIIQKCKDLARDAVLPSNNPDYLHPGFVEIQDLYNYLVQYCKRRNIAHDPMERSLDEILGEDEALRLSKALEAIEIPS